MDRTDLERQSFDTRRRDLASQGRDAEPFWNGRFHFGIGYDWGGNRSITNDIGLDEVESPGFVLTIQLDSASTRTPCKLFNLNDLYRVQACGPSIAVDVGAPVWKIYRVPQRPTGFC